MSTRKPVNDVEELLILSEINLEERIKRFMVFIRI